MKNADVKPVRCRYRGGDSWLHVFKKMLKSLCQSNNYL